MPLVLFVSYLSFVCNHKISSSLVSLLTMYWEYCDNTIQSGVCCRNNQSGYYLCIETPSYIAHVSNSFPPHGYVIGSIRYASVHHLSTHLKILTCRNPTDFLNSIILLSSFSTMFYTCLACISSIVSSDTR